MPQLSLVLGRRTIQVYDLDKSTIRIGRGDEMDVAIDNVSVSREHAHLVRNDGGWTVRDAGSANGTFLNGERVDGSFPLRKGDEISIGKFSIFFDKVVGDAPAPSSSGGTRGAGMGGGAPGTMYIKPSDVKELLKSAAEKRQAHLAWRAGGQEGAHPLDDACAVLVGQDELCDLRVPAGPKHHLLLIRGRSGMEARNLALWQKMKVDGQTSRRARLKDGAKIEMAGLTLTFVDELDG